MNTFLKTLMILCVTLVPIPAAGQAPTATLKGTALDESGSVVPGVRVNISNLDTGLQREAVTGERGAFAFAALPSGPYSLTAELDGFVPASLPGLVLAVSDEVSVTLRLRVARVAETVRVESGPAGSEVSLSGGSGGSVGVTLSEEIVRSLPLSGRTFQSLIALAPGFTLTPSIGSGGQFSVNGQRANANYFTIDGVSGNVGADPRGLGGPEGTGALPGFAATGATNTLVSMEGFKEVRIASSSFAPEFGRTPGAQVSIVTRSGSNDLRGSASALLRHHALDATSFFVHRAGEQKPRSRYGNASGSLGGPLTRDRLFAFGTFEYQTLRQPRFAITEVPSISARTSASGAMSGLLRAFPEPNDQSPTGTPSFSAAFINPSTLTAASGRVDALFSAANQAFVRVSYGDSSNEYRGGSSGTLGALSFVDTDESTTLTATGGWTHVRGRSGGFTNELRVNVSRNGVETVSTFDAMGGAVEPPLQSFVEPGVTPTDVEIGFNVLTGRQGGFLTLGPRGGSVQQQWNIVDTATFQWAAHTIKVGVDYLEHRPTLEPVERAVLWRFNTEANAVAGLVPTLTSTRNTPGQPLHRHVSVFAQDQWDFGARGSITAGVRYDVNSAPRTRGGLRPHLGDFSSVLEQPRLGPAVDELWRTSYSNLAPRVGGVLLLRNGRRFRTALRGGAGVFFDASVGRPASAIGGGFPFSAQAALSNARYQVALDRLADLLADISADPLNSPVFFLPRDLSTPRTYQWNIGVEQTLGAAHQVVASYVGAAGRDLYYARSLAIPGAPVQNAYVFTNDARSNYRALQLQWSATSGPIRGSASYTWGLARDTSSDDFFFQPGLNESEIDLNYGYAAFDIRQSARALVSVDVPGRMNGLWRHVLPAVDGVVTLVSGAPVEVRYVRNIGYGSYLLRPDRVPGVPLYVDDPSVPGGRRLNGAAFVMPTSARQGDAMRNEARSTPLRQIDLALTWQAAAFGRSRLEARVEIFNALNTINLGPPLGTFTSPFFGQATALYSESLGTGSLLRGGLNPIFQVGGPRSVQLALRYFF